MRTGTLIHTTVCTYYFYAAIHPIIYVCSYPDRYIVNNCGKAHNSVARGRTDVRLIILVYWLSSPSDNYITTNS